MARERSKATEGLVPGDLTAIPDAACAVVLSGNDRGQLLVLERGEYILGKSSDCSLVLRDPAVSRRHLRLQVGPDGVIASDLGSKNGSYYRGARFSELTVGLGAVITLGATEIKIALGDRSIGMPPSTAESFGGLIGLSLAMRQLFALLERICRSDAPVLIEGETGTGKELCAQAIHNGSARARRPLVVCDFAGVPRSLIESELFGHKRGAFTGADRDRDGCFVLADGGSILLDEVGELEAPMQPRLLRVLEQQKVKPVGGSRYRQVDVRVVAATNRDLREECDAGRFRQDLYHRLAVLRVRLPPLRERREDIPVLIEHFLEGRKVKLSGEAKALLQEHDWPGNVRELRNTIEQGLSLAGDKRELTPELLGLHTAGRAGRAPGKGARIRFHEAKEQLVDDWERDYLTELLRAAGGNISRAARRAGLARQYLHRLLRKHGIETEKP
jgi:transcriptional regulator with GAF, ATPase, and Fis domain